MTDIVAPALGESVTEATVAQWLKKPGEAVAKDEPIVELETDKVTLEVSAPEDGVLAEVVAEEGATVGIGALLGRVEAGDGASAGGSTAKAEAPPAKGGGETVDVTIPQMGESVAEGTVANWLVKVGDAVKVDDPLVEVETDKAAVEIPSPVDGVVAELLVEAGADVEVGSLIARVAAGAGAASAAPKREPAMAGAAAAPAEARQGSDDGYASGSTMPAARRVLAEAGVASGSVAGTGRGGRVTKLDAMRAIEGRPHPSEVTLAPGPARELAPREERVRMTRLRQTIARRLKEAQHVAAMLTTFNDCDMTEVMEARKRYKESFQEKHGVKLGFMGFFVKAVVAALKDVPAVNAEIDGDSIIYKNFHDIGVAVGTDRGLVVPVVRDADQKSLGELERDIAELGRKARDGELALEDMQGASFTISNGGVYGSLMSTPILNAPQSGILGMHRIEERPIVREGQVVARPMMYLALTYDHRVVDGKEAVTFLVRVKETIEDPERLLLEL